MGRGRMALIIQETFRKPVPMAPQSGGSTFIDAAAVPLADGRADNHTKEVCQAGGTTGIYGMTLCKTEKFLNGSAISGACAFRQYTTSRERRKSMPGGHHIDSCHLKASIKICSSQAITRSQRHGHYDGCRWGTDSQKMRISGIIGA